MLFRNILLKPHAPGAWGGFEELNDTCACGKTSNSEFPGTTQCLSAIGDAVSTSSTSSKKDRVQPCPEPSHLCRHQPSSLHGHLPLTSPRKPPVAASGINSPSQTPPGEERPDPLALLGALARGSQHRPGLTAGTLPRRGLSSPLSPPPLHPSLLPRRDLSSLCTMEFYFAILMQFWLRLKWNWKPKGLNK